MSDLQETGSAVVGDLMAVLKRPIFEVNGLTLTVGVALVIAVLAYLAFIRK